MMSHSEHDHSHETLDHETVHNLNMWKGFTAMMGVVLFFFTEKALNMIAEWRKHRQRRSKVRKPTDWNIFCWSIKFLGRIRKRQKSDRRMFFLLNSCFSVASSSESYARTWTVQQQRLCGWEIVQTQVLIVPLLLWRNRNWESRWTQSTDKLLLRNERNTCNDKLIVCIYYCYCRQPSAQSQASGRGETIDVTLQLGANNGPWDREKGGWRLEARRADEKERGQRRDTDEWKRELHGDSSGAWKSTSWPHAFARYMTVIKVLSFEVPCGEQFSFSLSPVVGFRSRSFCARVNVKCRLDGNHGRRTTQFYRRHGHWSSLLSWHCWRILNGYSCILSRITSRIG